MSTYKPWNLYWAEVAFEDDPTIIKLRPVVILQDGGAFIMSYYATSKSPKPGYDCYSIRAWKEAGLSEQTVIRLDKCLKLKPSDFRDYIGCLSEQDVLLIKLECARIANRR
jgi:hypothetical protein